MNKLEFSYKQAILLRVQVQASHSCYYCNFSVLHNLVTKVAELSTGVLFLAGRSIG